MLRSELVSRCAQLSGISPRDIDATLTNIERAIGGQLARRNGPVRIDDFGTFEWAGGGIAFRASPTLLQSVNQPIEPEATTPPELGPASAADISDRFVLPVRQIGAEDRELIERWLQARTSASPTANDAFILLTDAGKRMSIGTPQSRVRARKAIEAFARRCPVPLIRVGLSQDPGEYDMHQHGGLLREITDYFRDYLTHAQPRLLQYKESRIAKDLGWKEMAKRTPGWKTFYTCGRDFYDWLETVGLRPNGTNPFKAMARPRAMDLSRGRRLLVRKWCKEMLRYERMTPKERAILYLAAHGMRASEIAGARLDGLDLRERSLRIVGKMNKTRHVALFEEALAALEAYLASRRNSTSPWLFPGGGGGNRPLRPNAHIPYGTVYDVVQRIRDATFPMPEQANIRAMISPHKFRHYFITNAWARGMKPRNIMEQTGISNPGTLERYISPEPRDVHRDMANISKTRFL